MRRWILAGLGLLSIIVIVGVILVARDTRPRAGVAIIGDGTPQILAALDVSQALPLHTAALTVVSIDTWDKLPFVADMHALCADHCGAPHGVVRLLRMRPGGSDRVLFVSHDHIGSGADLACVSEVIRAEISDGVDADTLPDCAKGTDIQSLWSLPGLGAF